MHPLDTNETWVATTDLLSIKKGQKVKVVFRDGNVLWGKNMSYDPSEIVHLRGEGSIYSAIIGRHHIEQGLATVFVRMTTAADIIKALSPGSTFRYRRTVYMVTSGRGLADFHGRRYSESEAVPFARMAESEITILHAVATN